MPPSHVKTIRELIYWENAKLIAEAAVGSRKNYGFVTHSYKRLKSGKMNPSDILRENKMLVKGDNACAYCGAANDGFHWEHIIPKSRGGPDVLSVSFPHALISLPTSFMYPSLAPQQPWSSTASALRYALHCAR